MTGRTLFKIPDGRRALKLAREQGLTVTGYTVHPDGTIDVAVRDCEYQDGETVPPPSDHDLAPEAA